MAEKTYLSPSRVVRFGVFQANLRARELRKHGVKVRLPGQPFCVLSILLEKPGEVVSREEMRAKLWTSDTFVDFEHSLNSAVKKLRAALGDSPEQPRYIETIPRVGYRFIAPVGEVLASEPSVAEQAVATPQTAATAVGEKELRQRQRHWPALLGLFAVFAAAAASIYFLWSGTNVHPQPSTDRIMMAVLPFENLTGDPAQEYFSDGLTEEMISQLGRLDPEHLGVIARTSVMHYKHGQVQAGQIGQELGVQYVLEGSVRSESGRVRVTAQLIQTKDQSRVWSHEYDRELSSLLALQGEITQEIADEIHLTLGGGGKLVVADHKPAPVPRSYQAYDLYLKGRYFWNKRTTNDFKQAADYFQQSIAADPDYAPAYAGLSDTYALTSSFRAGPQNELIPKARAAALRALEIDEDLVEAHTSLALIAENYDYDWQTAEKEYQRAIQIDPQYATAHQWYAECLSFQGRFDEALAESERARKLDPLSLIMATDHGAILYFSRQYDRAIEQFQNVAAMDPDFPRAKMVAQAYVEKGVYAQALDVVQKWRHEDGTPTWEALAFVYARQGDLAQARSLLTKWEKWNKSVQPPVTSVVLSAYVAVGRKDDAIAMLQKAFAEHSNVITEIKVAPYYDPLRGDPRFQDLVRRAGLAK